MNSCREWSHCSSSHDTSLCIMEEVSTCRRNSSIEAVHSQHTVDTAINSVWEERTSKLFQIFFLLLSWITSASSLSFPRYKCPTISTLLYQILNRKSTGFTARWDQTHIDSVWQLESHFLPFSSLTLTLGTASLRDTKFTAKNLHQSKMMTSRWTADPLSLYSFLYFASGTHMAIQVCIPSKYLI